MPWQFRYEKGELIGKHVTILNAGSLEKGKEISREIADIINKKGFWVGQILNKKKDGTEFMTSGRITSLKNKNGKIVNYVSTQHDITDRIRTEKALRESEEKYKTTFEHTGTAMAILENDTTISLCNHQHEILSGYSKQEVEGKMSWTETAHPEDLERMKKSFREKRKPGADTFAQYEFRLVDRAGNIKDIALTANIIPGTKKSIASLMDITRRKQAEKLLKKSHAGLEKKVRERTGELLKTQKELEKAKRLSDIGTLAATVAHELRNPLGVMQTAVYNIRRKRQNSLIDKHLANIEKKVDESNRIISNLLFYSRIRMPHYENVNIHNILNECIGAIEKHFKKKGISIEKEFKLLKNIVIEADPLQMREMLSNILNNAYDAVSDRETSIEIKGEHDGDNFIKLYIKDSGVGIDEEDLEKVFEPFFTTKSKGTGLGLTVCHQIVNLHNGRIEIESVKGKETTVVIALPIRRRPDVKKNPDD